MLPDSTSPGAPGFSCTCGAALFFALGVLTTGTRGANYFVSPSGDDGNPGTLAAPFATIQKAIDTAPASSSVFLRAGVYREEVDLKRSSLASPGNPFVLAAYSGASGPEQVTISGFTVVEPNQNGNGAWELHSGNIHKIQLAPSLGLGAGETSVLVDGEPLIQARWPNASEAFSFDYRTMAMSDDGWVDLNSGGPQPPYDHRGTFHTGYYTASGLPNPGPDAWVGARILSSPGSGSDQIGGVVVSSQQDTIGFRYLFENTAAVQGNEPFIIWNSLHALDMEGEAFFDADGVNGPANTLYLWLPGGGLPANHTIEVRTRQRGLDIGTSTNLTVRHIEFQGADIYCHLNFTELEIDRVRMRYCGSGLDLLKKASGIAAVTMGGDNCRLRNSDLAMSYGAGVTASGANAVVENNFIRRNMLYGIGTWGGYNSLVHRNTVCESGSICIAMYSPASAFTKNHCYLAALHGTDEANIDTNFNGDLQNTEVAWNWVHTNLGRNDGGRGIRFDSGTIGVGNALIHHNLIWNITKNGALSVFGLPEEAENYGNSLLRVYHNTVGGNIMLRGSGNGAGYSIAGHDVRNNICWDFFNNTSGMDQAIVRNNVRLRPDNPAAFPGNIIETDVFVSAPYGNYRLREGSPVIDTGELIPGINDTFSGTSPDPGALEFSAGASGQWTAGAAIGAEHLPDLAASLSADPSGRQFLKLTNFPPGHVLPDDFVVRIGGSLLLADYFHTYAVTAHAATAVFPLSPGSSPGTRSIEYSFDGQTFFGGGTIEVPAGSPGILEELPGGLTAGSPATLNGVGFTNKDWMLPIRLEELSSLDLNTKPVPVVADTKSQIALTRMATAGNDIRFVHLESGTTLRHWVESGVDTEHTLCWLKLPTRILNDRFSQGDESLVYLTFGNHNLPDVSDRQTLLEYYPALDNPSQVLWLSANDLTSTHADGDQVPEWSDRSPKGNHGNLTQLPAQQPVYRSNAINGLPAVEFSSVTRTLLTHPDLEPNFNPDASYLVFYKLFPGGDTNSRLFSAVRGFTETFASPANAAPPGTWVQKSVRRPSGGFYNFQVGRKAAANKLYFDGLIAELIVFNERLPDGSAGASFVRTKQYAESKYRLNGGPGASSLPNSLVAPLRLWIDGNLVPDYEILDNNTMVFTLPAPPSGPEGYQVTVDRLPSTFPSWAQNTNAAGPLDDHEGDGLTNLLEYALDTDPYAYQAVPFWGEEGTNGQGEPAVWFFYRRNSASGDVMLKLQYSLDAQNWADLPAERIQLSVADPDPDGDGSCILFVAQMDLLPTRLELFRLQAELLSP